MDSPLNLSLTHGQVVWSLARGQPPSRQLLDQLRYLRQRGVPFCKQELGGGTGNRVHYGFDHLIELGVAVFGLQRGMTPREVAAILVPHRAEFRRLYRDVLATLPENAFQADWVKSRDAVPIMNEIVLCLNDPTRSDQVRLSWSVPNTTFVRVWPKLAEWAIDDAV